MDDLKVYTPEEAATLLKVTTRTLYSYLSKGDIRSAKIGRVWRITDGDIRAFLDAGRGAADAAREARSGGAA